MGGPLTTSAVVYTSERDAAEAGQDLARKIAAKLGGPPDALVVFASPAYDQPVLLKTLREQCRPAVMVGASSAGEFTTDARGEGLACALALRSSEMKFSAGIGRGLSHDPEGVARSIVSHFEGVAAASSMYRVALVLTDALAGHADRLIDSLTVATGGTYQFFGGGAGDNAQFRRTQVFFGEEAVSDAAVALEILSPKPIGIGFSHGWEPAGPLLRVTEAQGARLVSLNSLPAVQAFEAHAAATGQHLDRAAAIPFFLHNILGIESVDGFRLRVPLVIDADGAVTCAAEIPEGAAVRIMRTTGKSAIDAAVLATREAMTGLQGNRPQVALFFDCVATRLRMGDVFGYELNAVAEQLGEAGFVGCNTHGQIARAEGQFGAFHNCTAVVCVLPE
jgi:hypothetical protein